MLVSCPTEYIEDKLGGVDKAIEVLANAGFDAYDITLCHADKKENHWLRQENWRDEAKRLREVADKAGIVCNQSHAPFP